MLSDGHLSDLVIYSCAQLYTSTIHVIAGAVIA
jgi:hypothetical protein